LPLAEKGTTKTQLIEPQRGYRIHRTGCEHLDEIPRVVNPRLMAQQTRTEALFFFLCLPENTFRDSRDRYSVRTGIVVDAALDVNAALDQ
jgi:hypothetical protein